MTQLIPTPDPGEPIVDDNAGPTPWPYLALFVVILVFAFWALWTYYPPLPDRPGGPQAVLRKVR